MLKYGETFYGRHSALYIRYSEAESILKGSEARQTPNKRKYRIQFNKINYEGRFAGQRNEISRLGLIEYNVATPPMLHSSRFSGTLASNRLGMVQ